MQALAQNGITEANRQCADCSCCGTTSTSIAEIRGGGPLSAFGLGLPRRLVRSDTGGSGPRLGPTQAFWRGGPPTAEKDVSGAAQTVHKELRRQWAREPSAFLAR